MTDSKATGCNIFKPCASFKHSFTRFKDGQIYGWELIEQFEACLELHKKNKIKLVDGIYIFYYRDINTKSYYIGEGEYPINSVPQIPILFCNNNFKSHCLFNSRLVLDFIGK